MINNVNYGNNYGNIGNNNTLNVTQAANQDAGTQLQELVRAVQVMREQGPPAARPAAEEFLEVATSPAKEESHRLRDALLRLGAVATVVGQTGVPVIDAIEKVKSALGL